MPRNPSRTTRPREPNEVAPSRDREIDGHFDPIAIYDVAKPSETDCAAGSLENNRLGADWSDSDEIESEQQIGTRIVVTDDWRVGVRPDVS